MSITPRLWKEVRKLTCLYGWGFNLHGQLGNGLNLENRTTPSVVLSAGSLPLTGISAGAYHSFGTNSTLGLYAWGSNFNGQLGLGSTGATYPKFLTSALKGLWNRGFPQKALQNPHAGSSVFTAGNACLQSIPSMS